MCSVSTSSIFLPAGPARARGLATDKANATAQQARTSAGCARLGEACQTHRRNVMMNTPVSSIQTNARRAVGGPAQHGSDQRQEFRRAIQPIRSVTQEDLRGLGKPSRRCETRPGTAHVERGDARQVFYPAALVFYVGSAMPMVAVT